jgi:hypothetical protein
MHGREANRRRGTRERSLDPTQPEVSIPRKAGASSKRSSPPSSKSIHRRPNVIGIPGTNISSGSRVISITAEIPISGW